MPGKIAIGWIGIQTFYRVLANSFCVRNVLDCQVVGLKGSTLYAQANKIENRTGWRFNPNHKYFVFGYICTKNANSIQ